MIYIILEKLHTSDTFQDTTALILWLSVTTPPPGPYSAFRLLGPFFFFFVGSVIIQLWPHISLAESFLLPSLFLRLQSGTGFFWKLPTFTHL